MTTELYHLDRAHPRQSALLSPGLMPRGWTDAHSAAAWFVGECFATGAVLGLVTELTRPIWERRAG